MKIGTKAIHAGETSTTTTGSIKTPIYQTSTYIQSSPGDHEGYEYSRTGNPTRNALEKTLASLENGEPSTMNGNSEEPVVLYTHKGSVNARTGGQKKYLEAVRENDIVFDCIIHQKDILWNITNVLLPGGHTSIIQDRLAN